MPNARHLLLFLCSTTLATAPACGGGLITDGNGTHDPGDDGDGDAALRVCASGPTVTGIDVSYYQGTVDWAAVKRSGRAFAFARVSDGTGFRDPTFARNWAAMKREGLIRGAYQYFRASDDPIAQADLVLDAIGTLEPGDLPPVLDLETSDGMSSSTVIARAAAWVNRVEAATGRSPIIYTSIGYWETLPASSTAQFAKRPLWVANYGVSCPHVPDTWSTWRFWQFSESGSVPGVSGNTDVNVWNGTLDELRAFAAGTPRLDPIEVYWARQASGAYELRALAPARVTRVEYRVDGYLIASATRADGSNFPTSYRFSVEGDGRAFEVTGFDASGAKVARGIGWIDVTAGTAVSIRQMGAQLYEIGLERAPDAVAAIEVRADGWLLTDAVSGQTRSTRDAVRYRFLQLGQRELAITTYNTDGSARGTIRRTVTLE